MEFAFPNSNDVESWLVLKGIDDLSLYSFAHGEHHLSIVRYPKFHEQTIINYLGKKKENHAREILCKYK